MRGTIACQYTVGTSRRGDIVLRPRSPRKWHYPLFAYPLFKRALLKANHRPITIPGPRQIIASNDAEGKPRTEGGDNVRSSVDPRFVGQVCSLSATAICDPKPFIVIVTRCTEGTVSFKKPWWEKGGEPKIRKFFKNRATIFSQTIFKRYFQEDGHYVRDVSHNFQELSHYFSVI